MSSCRRWFIPFLVLLSGSTGALRTPAQTPAGGTPADAEPAAALIVPIEDTISTRTRALVTRGVREVRDRGARLLLLEIRSPGGYLDAMMEVNTLLGTLQAEDVQTVAYIDEYAFSAAAMIALACDRIYIRPGSAIGASTPVQGDPLTGGTRDLATDVRAKEISAMRGLMRATLERTSRNSDSIRLLVEAMVDPDLRVWQVTYKGIRDGVERTEVVSVDRLARLREDPDVTITIEPRELKSPLTLSAQEAVDLGVCDGLEDSIQSLIEERLHIPMSQVLRLSESWSDSAAAWINNMRPVLFVLGFILILIELKAPGIALPGILGVMMFAIAFFGSYLEGVTDWLEILLFFAGLGLLAVEIFVMPGMIFFGLAGFVCLVTGLILAQQSFVLPSNAAEQQIFVTHLLNFSLVMVAVMFGVWVVYANIHRIPLLRDAVQTPPEPHMAGAGSDDLHRERLRALAGRTGVLATPLRPSGWMDVDGERYDVVSDGSFLEAGTAVEVIEVRGHRVVVAAIPTPPPAAPPAAPPPEAPPSLGDAGGERGDVGIPFLAMLVLIGIAMIVGEVFFVTFGAMGIIAGVCLVSAVFFAFTGHGAFVGTTFLITCAILVPIAIKQAFRWLPHVPFGRHLFLEGNKHEEVAGGAQEAGLADLLDKRGVALCDLRPAGYARIDGRRVDVITRGELVDKDAPVRVVRVELNQVVVARDHGS